jgi:hypothetical protein
MKPKKNTKRVEERPHDWKYRRLVEGLTDDPDVIMGARFIDLMCLREQGLSKSDANKIIGANDSK